MAKPRVRWRALDDAVAHRSVEAQAEVGRWKAAERALVEGRRPGCDEAVAFDEARVEADPGGSQRGSDRKIGLERGGRDGGRQRRSDMLARGRKRRGREARRSGALDRSSPRNAPCSNQADRITAPARPDPRPKRYAWRVVARPKLEVRRQANVYPMVLREALKGASPAGFAGEGSAPDWKTAASRGSGVRRWARSGIGQRAGCS